MSQLTTLGVFTVDIATDEIILSGHGRYNNSRVLFTTTGTLPAGLSAATIYYCIVTSSSRFKVSLTSGGGAVDITDAGTGVHTCHVVVDTVEKGLLTYANSGTGDLLFPASTTVFITEAPVYADNAGKFIDIVHKGGPIGMYLGDFPYGDNVAGTPNPTFNLMGPIIDYGDITPDIFSPTVSFWNGGASLPAGNYRISYVTGAMQYAMCSPDPCWSVNTIGAGYHVIFQGNQSFVWFLSGAEKGLLTYASPGQSDTWFFSDAWKGLLTYASVGQGPEWASNGAEKGLQTYGSTPSELEAIISGSTTLTATLELVAVPVPPIPPSPSQGPPAPLPAATQRICSTCIVLDCPDTDPLDLYSLDSPIFPFVLHCPPGSICNLGDIALLVCCDEDVPVVFPPNATDEAKQAIVQTALSECARKQLFCGEIPELPPPGTRITLFFNNACTAETKCPDRSVFKYTVRAGIVLALSQQAADSAACRHAARLAKEHRVCMSALDGAICIDTAFSKTIKASGRYVASFPASDFWSQSGALPTGLTFTGGFQTNGATLSGTPTTAGTYNFSICITISTLGSPGYGDFMEKNFTVKVVGITTASSLPSFTVGVYYSQALDISGSHDIDLETWTIASGSLPDGLTLSKRLISGTPTVPNTGFLFMVQVMFDVQVILPNGIQGFKRITCVKEFTMESQDYGDITPDVFSSTVTLWNAGDPVLPAGTYRISYVTGAMEYAMCFPIQCWSVNTIGAGFHIKYNGGAADVLFPASPNGFPTQPQAWADNAGLFINIVHTGGSIGMFLMDAPYGDNVAGTPNPTFNLVRM